MNMGLLLNGVTLRHCAIAMLGTFSGLATAALLLMRTTVAG